MYHLQKSVTMFRIFLVGLSIVLTPCSFGQFYPPSSVDASWCMYWASEELVDERSYAYGLYNNVDTIIETSTYRIMYDRSLNNNHFWQQRYFLRNGENGKGYLRFPGSTDEYLTGDLSASIGDTVPNVFVLDYEINEFSICDPFETWHLVPFVVDTIITITGINGFEVTRHYVHSPCIDFDLGPQLVHPQFYWQDRLGTEFGPCLVWDPSVVYFATTVVVNDTVVAGYEPPIGSSANGACDLSVGFAATMEEPSVVVHPNPTPGRVTLSFHDPLHLDTFYSVFDATGRLLYERPLPPGATTADIDLTRFGPGTYVLRITDPEGQQNERVVVE